MLKRHLTDDEIEDTLDFIKLNKSLPYESSLSILKNNKDRLTRQLKNIEIYPKLIPELKKQLIHNYINTNMNPGESVGIIAAMSIGEKQTQNSVVYDEEILVKKNGELIKTTIGKFIDNEMPSVTPDDKNNYIKEVDDIQVLTVSQTEGIEWKYVKELSKHPTKGDLVKVTTESGRSVTTTLSHSHLRKVGSRIIPILGSELKIGDRIPVIKQSPKESNGSNYLHIPRFITYEKVTDFEDLVFSGNFHLKRLEDSIYDSNDFVKIRLIKTFIQLRGYLNNSKEILQDYQMLLTQFGILTHIKNHDLYIQRKYTEDLRDLISEKVPEEMITEDFEKYHITYPSKIDYMCPVVDIILDIIYDTEYDDAYEYTEAHDIAKVIKEYHYSDIRQILGDRLATILVNIVLRSIHKKKALQVLAVLSNDRDEHVIWDQIMSLELIRDSDYKHDFVYDFSVHGNETFALFSGIVVHNTLNSVDWKEQLLYIKNDECIVEPIGKMIDDLLLKYPENIEKIEENRTEYLKLGNGYFIPSCDEYGNTGWYNIEAITRHLPVGDLVKVTTESGRIVTATQSKSFLVWNEDVKKFIATAGRDVKVGDILPTTESLPSFSYNSKTHFKYGDIEIEIDREFGFIIGLYLTGNFIKLKDQDEKINNRIISWLNKYEYILYNITNNAQEMPNFAHISSEDFIKGLLSGYFRNCLYKQNGSIICKSYYETLIHSISFLLSYFGISGLYLKEGDFFVLEITKNHTRNLEEIWRELTSELQLSKYDVIFDKIISIEFCKGTTEHVYDLTVEETKNFQLFNGLNIRDTFHKA